MLGSICLNCSFGRLLEKDNVSKKLVLFTAILANLLILSVFKYSNFFVENLYQLSSIALDIPPIHLPLGISFFTFQTMSYVIDVYRGDAENVDNIGDLALYIALFPSSSLALSLGFMMF